MIDSASQVHREWRFTVELEPRLLHLFTDGSAQGERVILQGECDLLMVMEDEVIIVDYKTDRVAKAQELTERYTPQLELYASAVRQIFSLPARRCYLYSFALGKLIPVEITQKN
ncbi:MAG: PD-(D/E)XK nuclease family protein [Clostridia bacterium]|nr:PD-(D/E)XK nuclease family protein [Clostridia bacterium]